MSIGIIGAMQEEVVELKEIMREINEEKIGNLVFYNGKIKDKNVILVECGIGKVNAAICATALKLKYNVDRIIFTGVAGGVNPDINIGDVVIGEELIQHDVDCTTFGYELGQIPRMPSSKFRSEDFLVELAYSCAHKVFSDDRIWKGIIVSGDQFISSNEKIAYLREKFDAACTEMEGAAVAHVCSSLNIPFVIIRAISDKADSDAKIDYPEFVKLAAQNSKEIVLSMLERL